MAAARRAAAALHVGQRGGIGQQVADRRIEEALGALGRHAAARQHARDDVGHAMRPARSSAPPSPGARSAGAPSASPVADRFDAEKDAFVRHSKASDQFPIATDRQSRRGGQGYRNPQPRPFDADDLRLVDQVAVLLDAVDALRTAASVVSWVTRMTVLLASSDLAERWTIDSAKCRCRPCAWRSRRRRRCGRGRSGG